MIAIPSNGPIQCVDKPFEQGGQYVDVEFMASSHLQECCRNARFNKKLWHKSLDSQEFGFASNLVESVDVAPADELFYKGQLLPLQLDPRLHLVQALSSCEQGQGQVGNGGKSSMMLSWSKDEEVKFNSCRMEGVVVDKTNTSTMVDLRSSSFRSQNSGYWESGGDKDTGDSSSSSRDSNGSSQDSYFPSTTNTEAPCASYQSKGKASFNPWRSLFGGFKKASKRPNPHPSISKVAIPEDLSKYKVGAEPPLKEAKEALMPLELGSGAEQENLQERQAKIGLKAGMKSKPSISDGSRVGFKSKSAISDEFKHGGIKSQSTISDGLRNSFKGKVGTKGEVEERKKQNSAAVKESWLKPLYEVKRGLMGQFRMDDCGKNACEVESGTILRSPLERRLSHQSSLFKSHKLIIQQQDPSLYPYTGNMLAMSSCPPSTRSSPNHSGVLTVVDNTPKGQGAGNCTNANNSNKCSSNNTIVSSFSTMHESHSAVQSAIAHCKASNNKQS